MSLLMLLYVAITHPKVPCTQPILQFLCYYYTDKIPEQRRIETFIRTGVLAWNQHETSSLSYFVFQVSWITVELEFSSGSANSLQIYRKVDSFFNRILGSNSPPAFTFSEHDCPIVWSTNHSEITESFWKIKRDRNKKFRKIVPTYRNRNAPWTYF